jgi:hypothetical protein
MARVGQIGGVIQAINSIEVDVYRFAFSPREPGR